jgi:hypothetical protein
VSCALASLADSGSRTQSDDPFLAGSTMSSQRRSAAVSLPRGVHAVKARGRQYFYFQAGRGTLNVGGRIKLPNDPQSPEFWQTIRQAQGLPRTTSTDTISGLIAAYLESPRFREFAPGSQSQYRSCLDIARSAWGSLLPHHCCPSMCRQ